MALTKNVNGKPVDMTAEEEVAHVESQRASHAAALAEQERQKARSPDALIARITTLETEIAALKAVRAPSR